jgi:tetratricopeptide (TPR) repeat protein
VKNKIIENATKYIQKGQFDKAIKEYHKILVIDPKDVRIKQQLGELYARIGDLDEAIDCYQKVAEEYTAHGFFIKAIAAYKHILKINPDYIDINLILAQLYRQQGHLSEAMTQYQRIVAHHESAGDIPACIETLQKIIELDPDNPTLRIKLAEFCVSQSLLDTAIQEFTKASEHYKKNNQIDDYIKMSERIVFLDPTRVDLQQALAAIYLSRGEAPRALAKLQACFQVNPKDIETLTLLARAFQMSGEIPKTVSIYRELARIYGVQSQARLERETWSKVLQLAPNDPLALQHLSHGKAAAEPEVAPATPPPAPTPPPPVAVTTAWSPGIAPPTNLTRLLNETDIYLKYGLLDKARDHLSKLFEQNPDSIDAHDKAVKVHLLRKDDKAACGHLIDVIRLSLGAQDESRARAAFDKLREIDSESPALPAILASLDTGAPLPSDLKAKLTKVGMPAQEDIDGLHAWPPMPPGFPKIFERTPSTPASAPSSAMLDRFSDYLPDEEIDWESLGEEDMGESEVAFQAQKPVVEEPLLPEDFPGSGIFDWGDLIDESEGSGEHEALGKLEVPSAGDADPTPIESEREERLTAVELAGAAPEMAAPGSAQPEAPPSEPPAEPSSPIQPCPPLLGEIAIAPELDTSPEADAELDLAASLDVVFDEAPVPIDGGVPSEEPPEQPALDMDVDVEAALDEVLDEAPDAIPDDAIDGSPSSSRESLEQSALPALDMEVEAALDEVLDEAAFFINQGDLSEAREVLTTANIAYPSSDRVQLMFDLLQAHEQFHAERQDASGGAVADGEADAALGQLDLSTDILFDDEDGFRLQSAWSTPQDSLDTQSSFADIFSEFKKGIDQIVQPEDIETRYDLGLSYREMGLFDDAISEFHQAMQAARGLPRELDCLTMIALCQIAQGRFSQAEQALREGFVTSALTPALESALRFELASLYELQDRSSEALEEFQRVEQFDATYRDVTDRIARLRAVMG